MARYQVREAIEQHARIVPVPSLSAGATVDRTFEMPMGLYAATIAFYIGFLAVMGLGLKSPGLVIPLAVCVVFIVMLFGTPLLWTRLAPEQSSKPLSWQRFRDQGIMTLTGRASAKDAAVQVLLLPAVVFCWGLIVVAIAALV